MTRIKPYMCKCSQCKRNKKFRNLQRHSFAKQFRRKSKQMLNNFNEELPKIRLDRYTD